MKRTIIVLALVAIMLNVYAPGDIPEPIYIEAGRPVEYDYTELINAIFYVEARYDTLAHNPIEEAYGGLQIRYVRIEDYNKKTGKNYTLQDMYDFSKSVEVFLFYARQYKNDWETIAKKWNGSGPKTIEYWKRVQNRLNNNT